MKNTQPTLQEKKDKAIELMKRLDIFKPFIDDFKDRDLVCYFERYIGYWVYQEPEIEKKMKQIERRYKCKVYAITHEISNIGELWNFLIVTNYPEEWDDLIYKQSSNEFIAFAYVWNKSDEDCSELGSIMIRSSVGGIRRIG